MRTSIRWRLVTSYLLITLLTAGVVSVLALSLLQRSIRQQELAYLTTTAEGLARQALPLVEPALDREGLGNLVRAAAFLGNVRIRILDPQREALVTSAQAGAASAYLWIPTAPVPGASTASPGLQDFPRFLFPGGRDEAELGAFTRRRQPADTPSVVVVRRAEQIWGGRFVVDENYLVELAGRPERDAMTPDVAGAPDETTTGGAGRMVTVPIGDEDEPSGYVEVSQRATTSRAALGTAGRALLMASAGALLVAAVAGLWVSGRIAAPLRELAAAADRMAEGDLSARAPEGGRDEAGQLSRQFNRMADQVQSSFTALKAERDALRRFVADASHELRTPITALRTFNELLQDDARTGQGSRMEFLTESAEQIERLSWITGHLLDLTRLDAGLAALELTQCIAASLLEETAGPFRMAARGKGLGFMITLPDPDLDLVCDRARVALALSNLLDNAVKFTPPGGTVEIGSEGDAENVRFWVRDTGPGIPAAEQAHVFDRFYRGSVASGQTEGSGLGLAIVRAVAEAHGGSVSLESAEGEGSRFTLTLPRK